MARSGIGFHLSQSLGQHQLLIPRMLQSIEVLQLPAQELDAWLRKQAEENEAVDLVEPRLEATRPPRTNGAARERTENHDEMLQNQPDPRGGLHERVEEELAGLDCRPGLLDWVRFLVTCLDEAGYLSLEDSTLLQLASEQGLVGGQAELEQALGALQSLEPRGIGARGAVHALLLQLDHEDPEFGLLRALLVDFLEDVARNKLPSVARSLGVSLDELQRLLGRLGELELRPAAGLVEEGAPPLTPDVVIESDGDEFSVRLERSGMPQVRLDERVLELSRDKQQERDVRTYLRGKLDRARWLVDAVEQRERTLLRVAQRTFEHQRAFLKHGPGHLVPLRMSDLAQELEIHVSTVSRAVASKYAQTPWGILPLRHFFQSSAGADSEAARDDVLEVVRQVFAEEDPAAPLSDDAVVEAMAQRGWKLARRTVAKYRGELGIPSSYRRRKY